MRDNRDLQSRPEGGLQAIKYQNAMRRWPWRGPLRPLSRSASASRSTAICRPSS